MKLILVSSIYSDYFYQTELVIFSLDNIDILVLTTIPLGS